MTIQRMDNVLIVVDDLDAVISFFVELGMELEGKGPIEGRIRHRLQNVDVLAPGGTDGGLRQSINDLNHRLRYALGEYDKPPSPSDMPE